jgi:hypothetical protein
MYCARPAYRDVRSRQMSSAVMSTQFVVAYAKDVTLIGIVDLGSST